MLNEILNAIGTLQIIVIVCSIIIFVAILGIEIKLNKIKEKIEKNESRSSEER